MLSRIPCMCTCTTTPEIGHHMIIKDRFFCPKGVQIREVPLYTVYTHKWLTCGTGRQLRLLRCSSEEVMPFCIEVIIRTLKDVAFCDPKNDQALGQLLVLLQYQWPKEEEIFASLITTVQKRRRFYFPEFFEYVIRILFIHALAIFTLVYV